MSSGTIMTELLLVAISCAAAIEDRRITADIASALKYVVLTLTIVFSFSFWELLMLVANFRRFCSLLRVNQAACSLIRYNFTYLPLINKNYRYSKPSTFLLILCRKRINCRRYCYRITGARRV